MDRSYLRFNVQGVGQPGDPRNTACLRHQRLKPGLPGAQRERQLLGRADDQLQQLTGSRSGAWLLGSVRRQHLDKRGRDLLHHRQRFLQSGRHHHQQHGDELLQPPGHKPAQLVIETQNGPVATSTFTPTSTSTATRTPISTCNAVYHGPLTLNGTMSMTITNQTGVPLAVQDLLVTWDHDHGHAVGADKTLRLQQASLNGVSFWTGNAPGQV